MYFSLFFLFSFVKHFGLRHNAWHILVCAQKPETTKPMLGISSLIKTLHDPRSPPTCCGQREEGNVPIGSRREQK